MIHPREASLGEEARASLKREGLTGKAGDPQLKMKFARDSLSLSSELDSYPLTVGYLTVNPVKPRTRIVRVWLSINACL